MTVNVERLLGDPKPGITLAELANDLNQIAMLRHRGRVAFCKRLAVAAILLRSNSGDNASFLKWCADNIRSGTGKPYTAGTLMTYVRFGMARNPERALAERRRSDAKQKNETRRLGIAMRESISADKPMRAPTKAAFQRAGIRGNVASEVNALMTVWEQASAEARSQFLYFVTGRKVA